MTAPMIAVAHATPRPIQRRCHMPRKSARSCSTNSCMVAASVSRERAYSSAQASSKPALRDQEDIAGLDVDVGGHVAAFDQVLQPHVVLPAAFGGSHNGGIVAVREISDASNDDHQVQKRHPLSIRQGLRLGCLA